ncbi:MULTISPECIES: hypothetical protein [Kordiimonas]|jgi:hypothetical protein|uniref:hypothetical protein n=1 Tax=Kordiimonas TaxID=288021 RepID=UPI00257D7293|nr:hypothetical protein [Kordiimonas sp. UBA4487]
MTVRLTAAAAIILTTSVGAAAQSQTQTQTPPPPNTCETDPGFNQFDFWVGNWNVTARNGGQQAGTNLVTKVEKNCLIREEWTSVSGGTGQSINYYNPVSKKWRQVWVSAGAGGNLIDYEGGLRDGSMVLEGTITYYANGTSFPFRGTWTPNEDGTVRQFFEQYDETEEKWKGWFDGLYARQ